MVVDGAQCPKIALLGLLLSACSAPIGAFSEFPDSLWKGCSPKSIYRMLNYLRGMAVGQQGAKRKLRCSVNCGDLQRRIFSQTPR